MPALNPICADCGLTAPETSTSYTLISVSHGWRVTQRKLPNGQLAREWRCASCSRRRREAAAQAGGVFSGRS
jgi:hypothetical protein